MADLNRVPSAQQPVVDTGSWTATPPWYRFWSAIASAISDGGSSGGAADGFVPTLVADGETFTVPENRQALFAAPIQVDGEIVVDGELIEVD